jgi:DNA polymerase-3 subunit delta
MIYLFYGSDDLARDEYLAALLARAQDPMGDLNTARLEPDKLSYSELRHACDSVPFLSDRRIVIVRGFLEKLNKRGPKDLIEQLIAYVHQMPDYTRLFLLEGEIDQRTTLWKQFQKFGNEKPPQVFLKEFGLPNEKAVAEWIQQRAQKYNGRFDRPAATELGNCVGINLRLLDQEIQKLVTYANGRPVTSQDVKLLVPYVQEANVWDIVDAIGQKDTKRALTNAQQILQDDPNKAIYLHSMITRQIRLLTQVAELVRLQKAAADIQKTLGMSSFIFNKVSQQAKNFTIPRLERAYEQLLEADVAMKTGANQTLTLNLLIVELSSKRAA